MRDDLFDELVASVREGGQILRGRRAASRSYAFDEPDARTIRKCYGLSQQKFAELMGVSVGTLRNWEQHRRHPTGSARELLRKMKTDLVNRAEAISYDLKQEAWFPKVSGMREFLNRLGSPRLSYLSREDTPASFWRRTLPDWLLEDFASNAAAVYRVCEEYHPDEPLPGQPPVHPPSARSARSSARDRHFTSSPRPEGRRFA